MSTTSDYVIGIIVLIVAAFALREFVHFLIY
jgi:hypothetical protein